MQSAIIHHYRPTLAVLSDSLYVLRGKPETSFSACILAVNFEFYKTNPTHKSSESSTSVAISTANISLAMTESNIITRDNLNQCQI